MTDWIYLTIIFFLIALLCWRDWHSSKVVDKLTNKIMSRDWVDYASFADVNKTDKTKPKPKQDAKKPVSDPVLGIHC